MRITKLFLAILFAWACCSPVFAQEVQPLGNAYLGQLTPLPNKEGCAGPKDQLFHFELVANDIEVVLREMSGELDHGARSYTYVLQDGMPYPAGRSSCYKRIRLGTEVRRYNVHCDEAEAYHDILAGGSFIQWLNSHRIQTQLIVEADICFSAPRMMVTDGEWQMSFAHEDVVNKVTGKFDTLHRSLAAFQTSGPNGLRLKARFVCIDTGFDFESEDNPVYAAAEVGAVFSDTLLGKISKEMCALRNADCDESSVWENAKGNTWTRKFDYDPKSFLFPNCPVKAVPQEPARQ